eukprot:TRINITY_DN2572_c0_g2_i1.p1 TRINITY_DN2572_c0_g2~~TRINITY_DN2572_c0_g2_i1.p1  ORF type:complete len:400 (+),score=129.24 TRINITY_DN2572_c0_g2_i1:146-1345(+)
MKLHYFDMPGRAECLRLLLTHAGVRFEDYRIAVNDWPKHKSKYELKQLPVLEIDGKSYCQNIAILEYLGIKYKYLSEDGDKLARVMMVVNTLEEFLVKARAAVSPYSFVDDQSKPGLLEAVIKTDGPLFLGTLEKMLKENTCQDFIVGNKYTIADFYLLGAYRRLMIEDFFRKPYYTLFCEKHPDLKAYLDKRLKDFCSCFGQCKLKLYYFDTTGRAEMIRMLLKNMKIPFEDVRIKHEEWEKEKVRFEMQQLPVLECESCDVKLGQTDAIMHWLGKKCGLIPKNAEKFYKMLWWCNTAKDIMEGCVKSYMPIPEDKKKEILRAFYDNSVPVLLKAMEERLKSNKSQECLVGRGHTVADFYVTGVWRGVVNGGGFKEVRDQVLNYPILSKYLEQKDKEF